MIPLSKFERNPYSKKQTKDINNNVQKNSNIHPPKLYSTSDRKILNLNIILAGIHTILAIITLILSNNWNMRAPIFHFRVFVNYTSDHDANIQHIVEKVKNENISKIEELFSPELISFEYGLPITWLTFSFFAITAFFHFGAGILWYKYYLNNLKQKFNWLRWFEYSITAPLMWLVIAQSFAFIEITQLVLSTSMISITMATGVIVDWIARPDSYTDSWTLPLFTRLIFLGPGLFLYASASLTLLISMIHNIQGDLPPFIIPLVIITLALFESFAIVLIMQQCRPPSKWIDGEYWYLALSLISKATLGITLIANVLVYEQYTCIFSPEC